MTPMAKSVNPVSEPGVVASSAPRRADQVQPDYDVEEIVRGRGGRPAMSAAPATVESARLDPESKRESIVRAAEEHVSISEAIRRAFHQYLHAS